MLVAAGFGHIDAVSFGSKEALPERSEAELVMEYMDPPDDVEVIGLVADRESAELAVRTGAIGTVAFPYSLSAEFLRREQGREPGGGASRDWRGAGEVAYKAGMEVVVYLEMAFGNPFGEAWDVDEVVAACDLLVDSGVRQISLVDTAGMATPRSVEEVIADARAVHEAVEIGVHLLGGDGAAERVRAALWRGLPQV